MVSRLLLLHLLVLSSLAATASAKGKIGVAYGLNGDNLLSPGQTVALLRSKGVKRVRSYEARPAVTRAFANSGIDLIIGVPNAEVPGLAASAGAAISWVTTNVVPFPTTRISAIIVGNEWLADSSNDFSLLVPAMQNIYKALSTLRISNVQLRRIKVSTSHSLSVLSRPSFPPSKAKFSKQYVAVMRPLLSFLRKTGSYFMVNIVPYFAYMEDKKMSLEFVLFEASTGVTDPNTGLHYTNLFDLQLDAVYAAIAALSMSSSSLIPASSLCAYCNTSSSDVLTSASKKQQPAKPHVVPGEGGWPSGNSGSHTGRHFFLPSGSAFSSAPMTSTSSDAHVLDGHLHHHATLHNTSGTLPSTKSASFVPSHITSPVSPMSPQRNLSIHTPPCGSMHNHATSTSPSKVRPHLASSSSTTTSTIEEGHCLTRARAPYAEKIVRSEAAAATIANARAFNQNLIRHVLSAKGTPAHPTTPIQAYVFELFNEDLKPPGIEQHFGIFYPNGTAVYPINFHPRV